MQSTAQLQTLIARSDHFLSGYRGVSNPQSLQDQSSRTRCGLSPASLRDVSLIPRSPHLSQNSGGAFPFSNFSTSANRFSRASKRSGVATIRFQSGIFSRISNMSFAPIFTIPTKFGEQPLDISQRGVAKLIHVENSIQASSQRDEPKTVGILIREAGVRTAIDLSKSEALHFAQCIVNEANRIPDETP